VLEINRDALELFLACRTQFEHNLLGEEVRLDYPAVYAVADSLEIKVDHVVLRKIQILENDVLYGDPGTPTPPAGTGKPCRIPAACAMCQKECAGRLTGE